MLKIQARRTGVSLAFLRSAVFFFSFTLHCNLVGLHVLAIKATELLPSQEHAKNERSVLIKDSKSVGLAKPYEILS